MAKNPCLAKCTHSYLPEPPFKTYFLCSTDKSENISAKEWHNSLDWDTYMMHSKSNLLNNNVCASMRTYQAGAISGGYLVYPLTSPNMLTLGTSGAELWMYCEIVGNGYLNVYFQSKPHTVQCTEEACAPDCPHMEMIMLMIETVRTFLVQLFNVSL